MSANTASAARGSGAEDASPSAERIADALARAFALWRDRNYARPTRCDCGNRAFGGVFRRDARKFYRRVAETVHKLTR